MAMATAMKLIPPSLIIIGLLPPPAEALGPAPRSEFIRAVRPDQLCAAVSDLEADRGSGGGDEDRTAPSPLWSIAMMQRLSSPAAQDGIWLADEGVSCVAQVALDDRYPRRAKINMFHRGTGDGRGETVDALLRRAIDFVEESGGAPGWDVGGETVLSFAALDRGALLPRVTSVLASRGFSTSYVSECGLWAYDGPDYDASENLPSGAALRRLREEDAALVDARWAYRRDDGASLDMIRGMIAASGGSDGGCIGLYLDNRLVSWACRYPDGTIGMVHTEEDCRRRGYAASVLKRAVNDVRSERRLRAGGRGDREEDGAASVDRVERAVISYIVDSNAASRGLYGRLGWRRVGSADWAGFFSRKT